MARTPTYAPIPNDCCSDRRMPPVPPSRTDLNIHCRALLDTGCHWLNRCAWAAYGISHLDHFCVLPLKRLYLIAPSGRAPLQPQPSFQLWLDYGAGFR